MQNNIPDFNIESETGLFNPGITLKSDSDKNILDLNVPSTITEGIEIVAPKTSKIETTPIKRPVTVPVTVPVPAPKKETDVVSDLGSAFSLDPIPDFKIEEFNDIKNMMNPKKYVPKKQDPEVESVKSSISGSVYSDDQSYTEPQPKISPENQFIKEEELKQEYLIKLIGLEAKGVKLSKTFSMKTPLAEIKFEYDKQKNLQERYQSVDFMKNCLVTLVSGVEMLNNRYDPIGAKLNGWSETIIENMGSYETIFEKLHEKYRGSVELAPELELLFTLISSAFMYHMMQTMFKTAIPNLGQTMMQNPVLMKEMAKAVGKAADTTNQQTAGIPQPANQEPAPFDIGSLLSGLMGGLGNMGGNPFPQGPNPAQGPPPPQNTRQPQPQSYPQDDKDEVSSRLTDISADTDNSSVRISTKRNSNKRRISL